MDLTLKIQYSCRSCQIIDREVEVRARRESEDVIAWVEAVGEAVGRDHIAASLGCSSRHCDLKIPIAKDASSIGEATRQ